MDASNPRTRSQISLNPSGLSIGSNRPKSLGPVVLASVATAVALVAGQYGLLLHDVGVFWVLIRVLVCGGIGAFGWAAWTDQLKNARGKSVEWTVLGAASMAFLVQQATLLTALRWLSPVRIVILTHAYTFIPRTLSSSKKTQRWIGLLAVIALSLSADSRSKTTDLQHTLLSYGSLGLHALSTLALEHTQGTLVPALGGDLTSAATTLGAACLAGPLYGFRRALADVTHQPDVPLASLAVIPFLALAFTHLQPIATRSLHTVSIPSTVFRVSYTLSISLATVIPFLLSFKLPSLVDLGTAFLSYYAFSGRLHMDAPSRTPAARLVRTYMKTILRNPESRKIFYFLVLNLVYMGVQMLYGVWTNSLGLISDAIHMAFDCMAIGVGLIASVMATWDPNERFTYGYGRIETLSGFANGIFLILISIFIIFEAIERLIDPPEMETAQLLLVSSIGLGVNLFGLFAMGGHHHHGHSHSHGHSHGGGDDHGHAHGGIEEKGHGHSHAAPAIVTPDTHSHSHGHDDSHHKHHDDHGHSHDHGSVHTPNGAQKTNGHSHDGGHGHSHTGEHGHSHSQDHGHSHDSDHGHSHSGDHQQEHHERAKHVNGSDHEHSHSHSDDHGHSHSHHGEPTRSDDHDHGHGHSHDHSHDHSSESHSHSHGAEHAHTPPNARPAPNRRFSGPPIHIPPADADAYPDSAPPSALARTLLSVHGGNVASPITPNYSFVHDEHYERAHAAESGPNLHSHGHGHSHEGHSDNMRGVFLHVLADTMGSVGVIISTLLIKFYGWTGFDPIASLFIAILIVASVVPLVMDTGKILALDVSSRQGSIQDALAEVAAIPGVARYEAARFWPKDSSAYVGSIRIRLARAAGAVDVGGPHGAVGASYTGIDRVVGRVDAVLRERIRGLEEVTIEVEGE